jgi:hypothetical protein
MKQVRIKIKLRYSRKFKQITGSEIKFTRLGKSLMLKSIKCCNLENNFGGFEANLKTTKWEKIYFQVNLVE